MKQMRFTDFKSMTARMIKENPCVEVVADGEPLFIAIIGAEADMKNTITSHASMIDASRGKEG